MAPQFLALCTALSYAAANVSVRRGLRHSSAATATLVSLIVHTVVLGLAVGLTGGVPGVAALAVGLIAITGVLQTGMRLWHYTGIEKVGTSRAVTLRSTHPVFSVVIGVTILQEQATPAILIGTLLVVTGIIMTSWHADEQISGFRWRHLLFPMATALITGIVHPIRRYAMSIADEPLFFAAIVGAISLSCFSSTLTFPSMRERIVWNPNSVVPFIAAGVFETSAVLLMLTAFVTGPVVLVSPIAATSPIWTLLMSVVFLRDLERVNRYAVLGTLFVVVGVIAIYLA
ncbi:MAG: EamA family transporter [Candidatus Binatia bacterium]